MTDNDWNRIEDIVVLVVVFGFMFAILKGVL